MKLNKFAIASILLLAILTFGAVNAVENTTTDDLAVVSEDLEIHSTDGNFNHDVISSEVSSSENGISEDVNVKSHEADANAISSNNVPIDVKVVDNSRVDITIPNATGEVIVIIDDDETSMPLNNQGSTSVLLNNLSAGDHSVVVVYEGDGTHAAVHSAVGFNIPDESIVPMACEFSDIVVGEDLSVSLVLKDEKGNVIVNAPIRYSVDGVKSTKSTDGNGLIVIAGKNGAIIDVNYEGNDTFLATSKTIKLNNQATPVVRVSSLFNIPGGVITINGYAVDAKAGEEGIYYSTELLDSNGNPIKNADIEFAVNNKIYSRTTNDDGGFDPYKLNMIRAGRYTMAFFFKGNENYKSTFACVCVDLAKKPIKIKASAKTFKASAKSKKYSVTLSTIVGSSHDGNVHLSPKKVTLTVNGKTYSGNTNKNGQVTFNLKITKKGKYTAKINCAGDNTYDAKSKSVKITVK